MKCELCGTPVKVVGNITKHYEVLPIPWEKVWRTLAQTTVILGETYEKQIQDLVERSLRGEL